MQFQKDDELGAYVILGPLGAGAMGEVYRAFDKRLERDVALKILPDAVAASADLRARFQREARVLGSLNHPNVATLYGFEEAGETFFLTMEVVDGPTLEDKIKAGPIPIDETVELFQQIADGLEAAHDNGVVHRDLKPANIKVSNDGRVKLLDFGLAKAVAPTSSVEDMAEAPTREVGGETREGTILGTAAYMAPEQARGQPVDARADIWAFGACLYEALCGQRPFQGRTATDILAAVLTKQPAADALPKDTPTRLRRLLDRCLRKDRRERLRNISDARHDLVGGESHWYQPAETLDDAPQQKPWMLAAAAVAGIIVTWLVLGLLSRPEEVPAEPLSHLDVALPEGWVLVQQNWPGPAIAISDDGRTLVIAAQDEQQRSALFLRSLDSPDLRRLEGTEDAVAPFFSPDEEWVAFYAPGRIPRLKKASLESGAVVNICEIEGRYFGAQWVSDESILLAQNMPGDLFQVSALGGRPEPFVIEGVEEQPNSIHPVGEPGFFLARMERARESGRAEFRPEDGTRLAVIDIATRTVKQQIHVPTVTADYRVTSSFHLLYSGVRNEGLMAVALDPSTFAVQGPPVPVLFPNANFQNGNAQYAVAPSGTLVYLERGRGFGVVRTGLSRLVGRGEDAAVERLPIDRGQFTDLDLDPTGRRLLFIESLGLDRTIWMYDLLTDSRTVMLEKVYEGPTWDPSGDSFVVNNLPSGEGPGIFRMAANGVDEIELIRRTDVSFSPTDVSADGRSIVMYDQAFDISVMHLDQLGEDGLPVVERWLTGPQRELAGVLSPDKRWMAYLRDGNEVVVTSYPDRSQTQSLRIPSGSRQPRWAGDGRSLYYAVRGERVMSIPVADGASLDLGEPKLVGEIPGLVHFDVSRDEETLIASQLDVQGARSFRVVLNWLDELERLAPHDD